MTTSTNNATYHLFVGVDIAATSGFLARAGSVSHSRYQHGAAPPPHRPPCGYILVVMEATGFYWISLATTLTYASYAVSVI